MRPADGTPPGYVRIVHPGADIVALGSCADAVRRAVAGGSLYDYAAAHPSRRELRGRGAAYAVPLPDATTHVVVRHSRHGGLLAPVTGDRFLTPTRAPRELQITLRLADAGVPAPELVAYATYPAGPLLRRSDVATREVAGGRDLAAVLAASSTDAVERSAALDATAALLRALERAGAHHPDLNAANILIVPTGTAAQAFVLDVDRVRFLRPGDTTAGAANLRRLLHSLRKRRADGSLHATDAELAHLARGVGRAA